MSHLLRVKDLTFIYISCIYFYIQQYLKNGALQEYLANIFFTVSLHN